MTQHNIDKYITPILKDLNDYKDEVEECAKDGAIMAENEDKCTNTKLKLITLLNELEDGDDKYVFILRTFYNFKYEDIQKMVNKEITKRECIKKYNELIKRFKNGC